MRKMVFLTGAAVGYVLGARAGRERYEQICRAASEFRANPKFQQAAEMATQRGNEIAHKVADTATEKAHHLAGAMAEKAPGWMPGSRTTDDGLDDGMRATMMTNGRTPI
jgi:hypothetical protein